MFNSFGVCEWGVIMISRLPSTAASAHCGNHRIDIDSCALAAGISHVARVVAVPIGTATDAPAVFHGVAVARL